ncbi:MAG: hypothetical protein P9M13_02050 [Candidatus Ancaeobacter aquaticus]|nr:hypothetical protein [Candidatus Ancaeobacter aquaticus]
MALVQGKVDEASEGGHHDLPLRTLYNTVVDIDKKTIEVKFYERDGKRNLKTGYPELIFSKPFEFQLENK